MAFGKQPSRAVPLVIMEWHQEEIAVKDTVKQQNPLLTAFQYKKPLRHTRRGSAQLDHTPQYQLVDRIHALSDDLRTDLAPRFDQLENNLSKSVSQVRQKVDELDELQNEVRASVEAFTAQTAATMSEVDGNLDQLRDWLAQPRDISELQHRLEISRQQLQTDTTRLQAMQAEMSKSLSKRQENQRTQAEYYRIINSLIVIIIAMLIYYVFI